MVIVDQHAAHERIVYERMKDKVQCAAIQTQILLIPVIIKMEEHQIAAIIEHQN